ncbi:MAG TPA: thioesterase family protein [Candidatus Saccharimonadales bacterium]|nr:thioesterase family protein [Candidatus Saccharimonadales bacterium]
METLISELRVRSCDVDSFGHVNNAVYLMYAEAARNDYMLQCGLTFADFERWNAGPVLFNANLEYKYPARTDDELIITGLMENQGRTRFGIVHEMLLKKDKRLVCRANLSFAFVDLKTGRPCRIPEAFAKPFGI